MYATVERAIEVARRHIPIQQSVRKPECCCPFAITLKPDGTYAVYDADAWTEPTETPILPWSPPTGEIVGIVNLDGTYSER